MIKRISALMLSVIMLVSSVVIVTAQDSTDTTAAATLLIGLNVIDSEDYNPDAKMTRGEFATFIARLCTAGEADSYAAWKAEIFGSEPENGAITPEAPLFNDVDASHDEYDGISTVVSKGYMNGISENQFAPDFQIVFSEAVKVIVSMLGYDSHAEAVGGYPNGYLQVASNLKLTRGISVAFNEVPAGRDVVQLIYNALNVYVSSITGIYGGALAHEQQEETFLNKHLQLEKIEGRMTANDITSLEASDATVENSMVVGGKKLFYGEGTEKYRNYIGRYVEAYYSIGDNDEDTCVFMMTADNADTFTADNYVSFDGSTLKYSENNKIRSQTIKRDDIIIFNGVRADSYSDDIFAIGEGTVTIIPGDSGQTIVVVNSYQDFYVSNVSYENEKIYNELKFSSLDAGVSNISLAEGDEYEKIVIVDTFGNPLSLSDIKEGDVLSIMASADGEYLEAVICRDTVSEFVINAMSDSTFIGEGAEYKFSGSYTAANNKPDIKYGQTYKLYLNEYGKVVWLETGVSNNEKLGILTKAAALNEGALVEKYAVRLYTEDGVLVTYNLADKVKCNGGTVKAELVPNLLADAVGKPVRYVIKEDMVTEIITPAPYGSEDERGWYQVSYDMNEEQKVIYISAGDGPSFGGLFSYNANTKIFTVPTDENYFNDAKMFSVNKKSFTSYTSVMVEAYSTIKNDPVPQVLICRESAATTGDVVGKKAFLIKNISKGLDDDEEEVLIFYGYDISQNSLVETRYIVDNDAVMIDGTRAGNKLPDTATVETDGPLSYKDLEIGDIIRYELDLFDRICSIRIAFDYSHKNAFDNGKDIEWATDYGPVILTTKSGFKIGTSIMPEDIDYTSVADVNTTRGYRIGSKYPIVFVKNGRNRLDFTTGTIDDVVSYEMTKTPGEYDWMCVLTHYTGGEMGGVVYEQ